MKSISITRLKQGLRGRPAGKGCQHLKWKASRLRDWNAATGWHRQWGLRLTWNEKHLDYEIETLNPSGPGAVRKPLKWKASRLRDWNLFTEQRCAESAETWNEKHLDYEIETDTTVGLSPDMFEPEMKSISITRLKLDAEFLLPAGAGRTWNEKHLDYEIETWRKPTTIRGHIFPEMTSISITRLKRWRRCLADWFIGSWNEKHLDYEIETELSGESLHRLEVDLKWKASRLRDWN